MWGLSPQLISWAGSINSNNPMPNTSKLVQMKVCNLGCIGEAGLIVALDEIVCLVGPNNSGKSTVLRAYKAAVNMEKLTEQDFHRVEGKELLPTVEFWVHIPKDAENIDAKWKEPKDEHLLVRSQWTWGKPGEGPTRKTWDPDAKEYAEDGKASGLDNVFNSRLPKPFHIGSLEDPEEEHDELLKLVLEPVVAALKESMEKPGSEIQQKIKDLRDEANKPLAPFKEKIAGVSSKMNRSYKRVFGAANISLDLSLGDLGVDLPTALVKASTVKVAEAHGLGHWSRQGTGSQRALFWAMLEIRSELMRLARFKKATEKEIKDLRKALVSAEAKLAKAKAEKVKEHEGSIAAIKEQIAAKEVEAQKETLDADGFLPGHMLLIDEPETALHPSAIRGARDHLYALAAESGWQVMLTTHHPAFVDAGKDHTTVVRLERGATASSPKLYRTDEAQFSPDEKLQLKSLLAFDLSLAEIFFGSPIIVVEGDTEYACFNAIMDADAEGYPIEKRPLIVRARGKASIIILVRMLTHFKIDFAVLHDIDPLYTEKGTKNNPAFGVNPNIVEAVAKARESGLKVIHRCSCPNLEISHKMALPSKDKPLSARQELDKTASIKESLKVLLDDLKRSADSKGEANDGAGYEQALKKWIEETGSEELCYKGAAAKA